MGWCSLWVSAPGGFILYPAECLLSPFLTVAGENLRYMRAEGRKEQRQSASCLPLSQERFPWKSAVLSQQVSNWGSLGLRQYCSATLADGLNFYFDVPGMEPRPNISRQVLYH